MRRREEKRIKERGAKDPLVLSRATNTARGSGSEQDFALGSVSSREPLGGCAYFSGSLWGCRGKALCFHLPPQGSSPNSIKQHSDISLKGSKFLLCMRSQPVSTESYIQECLKRLKHPKMWRVLLLPGEME